MSTVSVRISKELLCSVRKEAKRQKQPIASYIEIAVEDKLQGGIFGKIKEDPDLFDVWKANIAMAFKDEYSRHKKANGRQLSYESVHDISNRAAENFLKLLIK